MVLSSLSLPALALPALLLGALAMAALWGLSLRRADASVVDLWWGPGFFAGAALIWAQAGAPTDARALLTLALLGLWAGRLLWLMLRRRRRHPGEDPRYTALRAAWNPGFWWKSLFVVFLLQALLQWIANFAALAAVSAASWAEGGAVALGALGTFGAVVAIAGLALESVADAQLDAHKAAHGSGTVCATGLRAHVRYPNYLGEMVFWWGVWLIAAEAGALWTIVSPLLLTLLLTRVSGAPMLEERLSAGRPGYAEWRARTPAFLPRLRRPAGADI
ncbi:MAG: DUF1295 domain-containing protein [Rubrimonas sp.]|uniref:DUF1295 domain-containing protein n=1 Tax=Rubrimonas sp. TaxID=2036015 RepID=UPI002FDED624